MSDLVINVKQIGSYPLLNPITGTEMLLVQSGGLGGPYYSVQMSQMIVNTLANFEGPIAIGVGQAPADGNPDTVFSGDSVLTSGPLGVSFNAYGFSGAGVSGFKYWQNGFAGCFYLDPASGGFAWQFAPNGQAGSPIYSTGGGPSLFTTGMTLSAAGYLQLAQTLLVARAPTIPLEVATKGYVDGLTGSANVVQSWNGRTGAVTLNLIDIMGAGGAPNQSPNFTGIPTAPTAPLGTATNQIATTQWVLNQITAVTAGVVTWNGRSGVVLMTPADITNAGGLTQITANATFLPLSGGTMAGPITMTNAAVANMDVPVLGQVGARVGASTPPATPAPVSGQLWWDSVGAQLYAWTGQQWVIAVNPPIPNTANFLPVTGGTITGPLQVVGLITSNAGINISAGNLNLTGNFTQAGNLAVTGKATVLASGSPHSLPASAVAGSFLPQIMCGVNNLNLNVYNDGTAWRQMPGTGTAGENYGGVSMNGNVNSVNIFWAPPVADNAAVTFQNIAAFSPGGTTIPGNFQCNAIVTEASNNLIPGSAQPWALGLAGDYLGSGQTCVLFNGNGGPYPLVWSFMQTNIWYPWIDVATAGGGTSAQANIGNTGSASYVSWPTSFSSDRRIKSNIAPSQFDALQAVINLQIYSADWAEPGDADKIPYHHECCFMADEVEGVVPRAVCKHPEPEKGVDMLNPLQLTAVLWKAVQELSAKVDALEAKGAA